MISKTISRYRFIKKLRKGGMGTLYLAEDLTLRRQVTVKMLSTDTKEYRSLFLREAQTMSALTHPNIPNVFESGESVEGEPYIVMEFVQGESLEHKLRGGSLPLEEAVSIVSKIADALGYAHRRGVIHRDIKPSNILIADGGVKLIDFGMSKLVSDPKVERIPNRGASRVPRVTGRYGFAGTVAYASPEQIMEKRADPRSDLFALGVVLYECITGKAPFAGSSWTEFCDQIRNFTPPAPSKVNDLVPPEMDRVTMKAIEKKVKDRYQSADQMIQDLDAVLSVLGLRQVSSTPADLQDVESEFEELLARMQTRKSKSGLKAAFKSSPEELGRAAVRYARKQR